MLTLDDLAVRLADSAEAVRGQAVKRKTRRAVVDAVRAVGAAFEWRSLRVIERMRTDPVQHVPVTVSGDELTATTPWPDWIVGEPVRTGEYVSLVTARNGNVITVDPAFETPASSVRAARHRYPLEYSPMMLERVRTEYRDLRITTLSNAITAWHYSPMSAGLTDRSVVLDGACETGEDLEVIYKRHPLESELVRFETTATIAGNTLTTAQQVPLLTGLVVRVSSTATQSTQIEGRPNPTPSSGAEYELFNPFVWEGRVTGINGGVVTVEGTPPVATDVAVAFSSEVYFDPHVTRAVDLRARAAFIQDEGRQSAGAYQAALHALMEAKDADPAGYFSGETQEIIDPLWPRRDFDHANLI